MSLIFTELNIRGSDLGVCNPTVDINNVSYIHASYALSDNAKKHKPKYFGEGMVDSMLPYLQQDNYGRELSLKSFKVAVLENENLKAVILTELGGRLYSLTDKKSGRTRFYSMSYLFLIDNPNTEIFLSDKYSVVRIILAWRA